MAEHELVSQPTPKPTAKLTAATSTAAGAGFVVWLVHQFLHADLPLPVAEAIVVCAGFAGGWLKKERQLYIDTDTNEGEKHAAPE
jgi:hypothetical protein